MNKSAISLLVIATGLVAGSLANAQDFDQDGSFTDRARVIRVRPIPGRVVAPQRECVSEYVVDREGGDDTTGGKIVGGIVGGLLGSQIGGGNGKVAAAAAGAIGGAIVGDRVASNKGDHEVAGQATRQVTRCREVSRYDERPSGYEVMYRYGARTYTTRTRTDPGSYIRVNVSVTPEQY